MPQPLVFDLETLPLVASLEAEYNPDDHTPPANYKSSEAVLGWHEKNAASWSLSRVKTCSLSPRLGRILCVSTSEGLAYAETEAEEKALLVEFWKMAHSCAGRIVTWNGKGFDAPFVIIRSIAHGITPLVPESTIRQWARRYSTEPHCDVKEIVTNGNVMAKGEGLDEWAAFMGLPLKPGVEGADIHFLHANGDHDKIREYCVHDQVTTGKIYSRLIPFYGAL